MSTNKSRMFSGLVSSVLVRNCLLLVSFSMILLLPAAREAFAAITVCINCDCYNQDYDLVGVSCLAVAYCLVEDSAPYVYVWSGFRSCPGTVVLNTAATVGAVGGNSIGGSGSSVTLSYGRVCESFYATAWCNGLSGEFPFSDPNCCSPPPPPPPSYCEAVGACCNWNYDTCACEDPERGCDTEYQTPILISVGPNAEYSLVGLESGVWFDFDGDGSVDHTAWTAPGSPLAFLVVDRNGNGRIDDGTELFGNNTRLVGGQRATDGFNALAEFDRPENGGNGDGWVDTRDGIWTELLFWIDRNHDAVSDATELYRPADFGVTAFSLSITSQRRRDRYGNLFRLKAAVLVIGKPRFAYDVYFRISP